MEKKNTILLTVIAIATLLVAVVGATFAYFTATVTTENEGNNTTTVKTYALAQAKMDMGSLVEGNGVYPGYKAVKEVTVTGSCPEGQTACEDVNAVITVTPNIPTEFGTDVTWKLYKSATEITCTNSPQTTGGQYYDNSSCTIPEAAEIVIDNGSTAAKTLDVVVESTTNDNYYLVVEYANSDNYEAQNTQQGKSFTVALDFTAAE